jgi:hypothetical protein
MPKVKAAVCPHPQSCLSQSIAFRVVLEIAYTTTEVRFFSGDKWGNYECIAYVSKGKSVALYVMSSRSKEGLIDNINAFKTVVLKSVLMNVTIQK